MNEERVRNRETRSPKEAVHTDRTPVEERHYSDGNEDIENEDDWMEREMKKAKSSTKEAASVKTMTTSDGLKIGIEPTKRHHSHHRSHHHSHGRE